MNKINIVILMLILVTFTGIIIFKQRKKHAFTIGIIQTASHSALDATRKGFIQELENTLDKKVNFIIKNAQGSVSQAHLIAQSFANDIDIDAIFAIATLASQTAANIEKSKPIIIAAVTDPQAAGINQTNVCGSKDMIDVKREIDLLQALVSNAKTVAILSNPGEINARKITEKFKSELVLRQIQVIEVPIIQESDVPLAVDKCINQADVILTPLDNIVASTIALIAQRAKEAKKPLIVSDNLLVAQGALAASGVDYFLSGQQSGQCAIDILLNKKSPENIGFMNAEIKSFVINKNTLEHLDLEVPDMIKNNCELIEG
ncbi:MAG: ABC transporter substrate-binding protein [Candidatus Babeliales bacterium]|nr:ABC transporter substrate-binding protein [Candidatus Babeliales bacterium]